MYDPERLSWLARDAGAVERERRPSLQRVDSVISAGGSSQERTRERLILQRKGSAYYKDPSKQKRNVFRTKEKKEKLTETSAWVFSKAERFALLDQLIRDGGANLVTDVHAILTAHPNDQIDANTCYVSDESGEQSIATGKPNGWLNIVGERDDSQCVRLLCTFGANQRSKDETLGRALGRNSRRAAKELLSHGANPNVSAFGFFTKAVTEKDSSMIEMFLDAEQQLNQSHINQALIESVGNGNSDQIAMLFAHGADPENTGGLSLCKAAAGMYMEDFATILLYCQGAISPMHLDDAMDVVCSAPADALREKMIEMLLLAGADANKPILHDQLLRAVKEARRSLVELLMFHGTPVDRNEAECLRLAILTERVELMNILLQGHVSQTSASRALDEAAALETLEVYEQVATALLEHGVMPASAHTCLAVAVEKGCDPSFAQTLLTHEANIDYQSAQAIRLSLRKHDLRMFRVLLQGYSTPAILCRALPDAMEMPYRDRLDVMNALLAKGVSGKELHLALQSVVSDLDQTGDYELLSLLLQNRASVDYSDDNGNCISVAVARNDERALDLLVSGLPNGDTVSAALGFLTVSFEDSEAAEYEQFVRMATVLLSNGATGDSANEHLVEAVRSDYRGKVLDLLLEYEADANFKGGEAVSAALQFEKISHLQDLCRRSQLNHQTFVNQLPHTLVPKYFDLAKATLFAETCSNYGYQDVLDRALVNEVQTNGARREVVELLLRLNASVDHQDGAALRHVVSNGDIPTTKLLLSGSPSTTNVARAFPATMHIADLEARYVLMQSLLHSGGPGMGNEALVQAAREAKEDLSHVELLLDHNASPNYNAGSPVLETVAANNLPLLERFLATDLNATTLTNAFNLARQLDCDRAMRHEMFLRLLVTGFKGFQTDTALIEVVSRLPDDIDTTELLLAHGASVNAENGRAMQVAAAAASSEVLRLLLTNEPTQQSRDAAMLAAVYTELQMADRNAIYSILLNSGISIDNISLALLEATGSTMVDDAVLQLLIDFDAHIDAYHGRALDNVAALGEPEKLRILLRSDASHHLTLETAFRTCMSLARNESRRSMIQQLLEKEPGIRTDTISLFLAHVVHQKDHDLLSLLATYKLNVACDNGEGLVIAAQSGDGISTGILTRQDVPARIVNRAFEAMLDARSIRSTDGGLQTATILLRLGVAQDLINRALLDCFDNPIDPHTTELVELLIPYKPDFSAGDGKLFTNAAVAKQVTLFKRMAGQGPDLNVVIPALILCYGALPDKDDVTNDDTNTHPENDEGAAIREPRSRNATVEDAADDDGEAINKPESREVMVEDVANNEDAVKVPYDEELASEEAPDDTEPGARQRENTSDSVTVDGGDEKTEIDDINNSYNINDDPSFAPEKGPASLETREERLIFYLQHLYDRTDNKDAHLDDSIIFTAMTTFPEGVELVKHLLDHGCAANSKARAIVDPSGKMLRNRTAPTSEEMTAVIWALVSQTPIVGEEIIVEILERGESADPGFKTLITQETATILAGAAGHCTVLQRLIDLGADAATLDTMSYSPTFYASRNGHLDAVKILHSAGGKCNDGSLQEASRESHTDVVEFLLSKGHRADYPSSLHADVSGNFGRTALEELCLHAAPGDDTDAWDVNIRKCIDQLLPKDLKLTQKTDGKTMLHLAVENRNPVPVTAAILDFEAVWEHINHSIYIFRAANGYYYSPTKYVELLVLNTPPEIRRELIALLHSKKCDDKFYAHTVAQPVGAIGLPEDIALAVDKQNRADHEHSEAKRRQDEIFARQRKAEAEDYQRRQQKDKERHDNLIRQQREQEAAADEIARRKHKLAQSQAAETHAQRQAAVEEERRVREQAREDEDAHRSQTQQRAHASELQHMQNLQNQELSTLREKRDLEAKMANERNSAAQNEFQIMNDLFERRKAAARYEREQREAAARAEQQARMQSSHY